MRLHQKTYGKSGPPLVILHGLFGSLDNWATLANEFSSSFRVFTYDARNHGRSPHSATINFEVMAEDLLAFLQSHDIPSANLIGHSMGGKTVMQFALTYPEATSRIMVVDVAPRSYTGKHDAILDALCALRLDQYRERKEIDDALQATITSPATRQFLLKNIGRSEDGSFRWKMNLPALKKHYPVIAGNITASGKFLKPTMFIKGGLSRYIVDNDRAAIKERFPKAIITTIKQAGHWVHSDAPEEMKGLVYRFFQ